MEAAVAYYRVSTKRQQRTGLGIDAQRAAVIRFAEAERITLVGEYVEAETGKGADALDGRPELTAALSYARKLKCSVILAISNSSRLPSARRHSMSPEPSPL